MTIRMMSYHFLGLKVRDAVTYTVKLSETDQIEFTYDESGKIANVEHMGSLPLDVVLNAINDIEKDDIWGAGPYNPCVSEAAKYLHKHIAFSPEVFIIDIVRSHFEGDGKYEIAFTLEGVPGIRYYITNTSEGITGILIFGRESGYLRTTQHFLEPKTQERIIKTVKNHEKVRLKFLYQ